MAYTLFQVVKDAIRAAKGNEVCYTNLGCFGKHNKMSFTDGLPSTPESIGTTFLLYSPTSTGEPKELDFLKLTESMWEKDFTTKRNLAVLIHGFDQSRNSEWYKKAIPAFQKRVCLFLKSQIFILGDIVVEE